MGWMGGGGQRRVSRVERKLFPIRLGLETPRLYAHFERTLTGFSNGAHELFKAFLLSRTLILLKATLPQTAFTELKSFFA